MFLSHAHALLLLAAENHAFGGLDEYKLLRINSFADAGRRGMAAPARSWIDGKPPRCLNWHARHNFPEVP
jgi:hypothetical protein